MVTTRPSIGTKDIFNVKGQIFTPTLPKEIIRYQRRKKTENY